VNYYERYCGDYARDTGHLSLQEHGAYTVMLDTYYATETPLPADYKALYRICRAMGAKEQEAVRTVADQFFPLAADGFRHNAKADKLIAEARPRIDAARENGKKGGRPRTRQVSSQNPVGFKQEPSGKAHQHQHQHQEKEEARQPASTPAGLLSAALRAAGVTVTPSNPYLLAWVAAGCTEAKAQEAVTIARDRKPAPQHVPAAYLDPIIRELLEPKALKPINTAPTADDHCCQILDGERCGKPGAFGRAGKWYCREHNPH
jgi:uncharacterized protein YdaU (DUF1376 family)